MSESGIIHRLFPTCLYVSDIENAHALNAELLPPIYRLRELDRKNVTDTEMLSTFENEGWTTFFSHPGKGLIDEPWTRALQQVVLAHVSKFVALLKLDFGARKPRITTLFANIHDALYHHHDAHTHAGSMFSGTYYIKSYQEAGKFRLVNPVRALKFFEFRSSEQTDMNVDEVAMDCVAGRLVMFQSHVPHSVDRPTRSGERVAIAFNVNYA